MALPTTADVTAFRARFPEFGQGERYARTDDQVDMRLDEALALFDISGKALPTLYAAAHMLVLDIDAESDEERAGEVVADAVGPLRVSYKAQAEAGREVFFTRTEYGRRYLSFRQHTPSVAVAARVV